MSMRSASKQTRKTRPTLPPQGALQTELDQEEVVLRPSSSPLVDVYNTDEFKDEWANDVRFHIARNLLHLRRFREMSQSAVAKAVGTSQSAIARIESGQENTTVDTVERIVKVLGGRFFVTIPPRELSLSSSPRLWWESTSRSSNWTVVRAMGRATQTTHQLIIGLECPINTMLLGNASTSSHF